MKKLTKIVAILTALAAAVVLASCSTSAAEAVSNNSDVSRSQYNFYTKRVYSDLNPGFGKAVYFTGTFYTGDYWTNAVRGTYDEELGKWYCDCQYTGWAPVPYANLPHGFEWKCLVGDWDLGYWVKAPFTGLTWENSSNHVYDDRLE